MRNASNAILEEFPHMISSMALLWGVVKGCDSTHGSKASPTSVYFKGTKVYLILEVNKNNSLVDLKMML